MLETLPRVKNVFSQKLAPQQTQKMKNPFWGKVEWGKEEMGKCGKWGKVEWGKVEWGEVEMGKCGKWGKVEWGKVEWGKVEPTGLDY